MEHQQTPADQQPPAKKPLFTRRRAMGVIAGASAACVADAFLTGTRWLSVTRKDVVCPAMGGSLDGLRVGVMADIHHRPGKSAGILQRAVERMLAEKPDLILMPGDFIDQDGTDAAPMMRTLSKLQAPHGVFACMGNHDGWTQSGFKLRSGFEKLGFNFLINAHTRLSIRGEPLAVAATDHIWLGHPAPGRTLAGLPAKIPVLGMVHEPDFFDEFIQHRPISLQVSGHTHGGQCQVPLVGYPPLLPQYGKNYVEGIYEKDNSRIFVTRGIGTSSLPVRFACRPEVAILTLRAQG
jgi:predicted MPP superfamily phosphohydrolase